MSPFLGSSLVPSSCSGAAQLLAFTLAASQLWLLTVGTKVIPHAGAEQLQGRGRAITGSDQGNNSQGQMLAQEEQLSHGGTLGQPLPWQWGQHHWAGNIGLAAALRFQGCHCWV